MCRFIWKLLFWLLGCCNLYSQERNLTLEECIVIGEQSNLDMIVVKLQTQAIVRDKRSVASRYLPDISVNGNQNYNFGSTIDPTTNTRVSSSIQSNVFSLDAGIELLNISGILETQKQRLDIEVAKWTEEERKLSYRLQLIEYYYEALDVQNWLGIQRQQFMNSEENFKRIEKEVSSGAKPVSDLYDIKLIYSNDSRSIIETENDLYNKKAKLFNWMNYSEVVIDEVVLNGSKNMFFDEVEDKMNPTIFKKQKEVKRIQKQRELIKVSNLPRLQVGYSYGSFYSRPLQEQRVEIVSFEKQLKDNKSHYLGLRLSIPIFQGGQVIRDLRKNDVALQIAEQELKRDETLLKQELRELEDTVGQIKKMKQHLEESLKWAENSFITTQVKYEVGKTDVFTFNQIKNQVLNIKYELSKNRLNQELLSLKLELKQ